MPSLSAQARPLDLCARPAWPQPKACEQPWPSTPPCSKKTWPERVRPTMSVFSPSRHRLRLRGPSIPGKYSLSLAHTIDERDASEWHAACGGRADTVMDPRFLRAVERSMRAEADFCNVVFHDPRGRAAVRRLPLPLPHRWSPPGSGTLEKMGYPPASLVAELSQGQGAFLRLSGFDRRESSPHRSRLDRALLCQLDRLMVRLARAKRTSFVVFKEFAAKEIAWTDVLRERDYVRADSLPMNYFPARFRDFDHFVASIRSRYRTQIRRSRNKFALRGCVFCTCVAARASTGCTRRRSIGFTWRSSTAPR